MSSTQKPSTSLLREMKNHQAYASTNVRKNLDTTGQLALTFFVVMLELRLRRLHGI